LSAKKTSLVAFTNEVSLSTAFCSTQDSVNASEMAYTDSCSSTCLQAAFTHQSLLPFYRNIEATAVVFKGKFPPQNLHSIFI